MASNSLGTKNLDQKRSFLSRLARQYKKPYLRLSTCAEDHDSYLDTMIQDIKEMRRDCLEAAGLAKEFLKSYEAITFEQVRGEDMRVKLEERLTDMNTDLGQANREIGVRENKIEFLERELAESEHSYKTLYHEHAKSKRAIEHIRKELETIQRVNSKKDVAESNKKNLLDLELYKESKDKAEQLQALVASKEAELEVIIERLDQLEEKLMYEVSINEKNKLIISQLTSENEECKREAEEYRIKYKISEENLQKYELEITQFRAMISNLDKSKVKFSGLSIDMHFEDFMPIIESPRTTPSLADMLDENEFEQREDTPVLMMMTKRNLVKTPRAFKFGHAFKEDLNVHTCESVIIEGKKEVDRSNLRFKIEVTHHSKIDLPAKSIDSADSGMQTSGGIRNMQNQCGISIKPERRMHEVCYLDNCLVDIQKNPGIKPVLCMKKDSVSYSIVCEARRREYETVRKEAIDIPSVELRRPNLVVENGIYASFIDISPRTSQFSLYKSPAIGIEPVIAEKSLKIQSEQQLTIQSITKKPKTYVRRSLNSATASGRSLYTKNPVPMFTQSPKSNVHFRLDSSSNSNYIPVTACSQQDIPRPLSSHYNLSSTLSACIASSPRNLTTNKESIIDIHPIQPNSIDCKSFQESSDIIMEIMASRSHKRSNTQVQSTLETQYTEESPVKRRHQKQNTAMTAYSDILSFREGYSNSLSSYEDTRSVKSEISSRSRRSRAGTQSCAKCLIF